MKAVEHYREAERLLAYAKDADPDSNAADVALMLQFAQVHAALAQVDEGTARAAGADPVPVEPLGDDPEQSFARNVRAQRVARGWTQADLANELRRYGLDLHPSAISKIERESDSSGLSPRLIRLSEAVVFARVLGIDLTVRAES